MSKITIASMRKQARARAAAMRRSYPSYDKQWSKREDAMIQRRVRKGMRPCEIGRELQKKLGRTSTAIACRASILRVCECR